MEELKVEIDQLKKEMLANWNDDKRRKVLKEKLDLLMIEYKRMERAYLFQRSKYNENDIIDLRQQKKNKFLIYLHDKNEVVGTIEYKEEPDEQIGNIIYTIYEKYRGNNYAYHALCLLGEKLNENGIDNIVLCADENNIASIKTIEKYNGNYIGTDRGISKFTCSTKPEKKKKI